MKLGPIGPIKEMGRIPLVDPRTRSAIYETKRQQIGVATDQAQTAIKIAGSMYSRYQQRESNAQSGDFQLGVRQANVDLDAKMGNRIEFDRTEVPEEVIRDAGIPDSQMTIPRYQIESALKRSVINRYIEENSTSIVDEGRRQAEILKAQEFEMRTFEQSVGRAMAGQPLYHTTKTLQKVTDALKNYDFAEAVVAIEESQLTDPVKQKEVKRVMNAWQKHELNNTLVDGTDLLVEDTYERLVDRDQELMGDLTEEQWKSYIGQYGRERKNRATAKVAVDKGEYKMKVFEAGKLADLAWKGTNIDTADARTLAGEIVQDNPTQAANLDMAVAHLESIQDDFRTSSDDQEAERKRLASIEGKEGSRLDQWVNSKRRQALVQASKDRGNDFMKWLQDTGTARLPEVDPANIGEAIIAMKPFVAVGIDHYNTFTGYFPDEVADKVTSYYDKLPDMADPLIPGSMGKVEFMGQVEAAFKGDKEQAALFWEQIKDRKMAGTASLAGQFNNEGDKHLSAMVLKGSRYRKQNPELINQVKVDIDRDIIKTLGDVYRGNGAERELRQEAIYDMVAYQFAQTGGKDQKNPKNNKDYNAYALNAIVGPTTVINKFVIPNPSRNIDSVEVKRWWDDLSAENFDSTGMGKQIRKGMDKGNVYPVSMGANQYALQQGEFPNEEVYRNTGGTVFVLSYDPMYKSIQMGKMEKQVAEDIEALGGVPNYQLPRSGGGQ